MATEIERKFLVDARALVASRDFAHPVKIESFEQGYLADEPAVRIRTVIGFDASVAPRAYLTIKGKGDATGRSRPEYEYAIPYQDGVEMLEMCCTRLTKVRRTLSVDWRVADGDHHLASPAISSAINAIAWEVDCFTGRHDGLWLAEIELKSIDQTFERPSWLGREVTDDKRYSNASIARSTDRFWEAP